MGVGAKAEEGKGMRLDQDRLDRIKRAILNPHHACNSEDDHIKMDLGILALQNHALTELNRRRIVQLIFCVCVQAGVLIWETIK